MREYLIKVDCHSPELKVKSDPKDGAMVKTLYDDLVKRFDGIDDILLDAKAEKVVITIIKKDHLNDEH